MAINRLRTGKEPYAMERLLLREWLEEAEELALLAVGVPLLTDPCRGAEEILAERGPCMTFRIRGEARDRDRFTEELWRFWHRLRTGEEPASTGLVSPETLLAGEPEAACYLLLDGAQHLEHGSPLAELLERWLPQCGKGVHVLLFGQAPIAFLEQADTLPRATAEVTVDQLILDWPTADEWLRQAYPTLLQGDRRAVFQCGGGWVSAMDAAAERLAAAAEGAARRTALAPQTLLLAVRELLERWTARWSEETMDCMERLCICEEWTEELAVCLTDGAVEPLHQLARQGFLVRGSETMEPVYRMDALLRLWLYHRANRIHGRPFLLEQHRLAATFGQESGDWMMVFFHQLRRGYAEETARTLRYLSFSELPASLLDDYRALLRKMPAATIDRLPWVQLGYAIAMKYRHPHIAFRYLDRAIEIFQATGEREGVMLACCQKISMGFFAPEQKPGTAQAVALLEKQEFADGELDPVLDGYRKVFTAYAITRRGEDYPRAIALLEQAQETAVIQEDLNLRLWVCFVMILTYRDCQYANSLRTILDEAMELVEEPVVQRPLKMCLYQTVAFLCHIEGGQYGEACACCERAARIADEIEASGYSVYINMVHAYALDCLGRFDQAERVILETARVSGSILNVRNEHLWAYYLIGQSYHYFLKGDWGLALDTAEKAVSYAARSGRVSYRIRGLLVLGNILADRGRWDRVEQLAAETLTLCAGEKRYQFYELSALFLMAQQARRENRQAAFADIMTRLAAGSKESGIYHYNFTKPATICEVCRDYTPPEQDASFFLQVEAYNDLGGRRREAPILEELSAHTPVEVQVLGPLSVTVDGETLAPAASAKAAQLLRLLALYGEPLSIHKLMEAIWPDWDEKTAMNNFYFTLYQLRTYLGRKDAVVYKRGLCSLDSAVVTVDGALLGKLTATARQYLAAGNLYAASRYFAQAARLCRGVVLDGDDLPEDALLQREALERSVFTTLRDYGALCIQQQNGGRAEEILAQAVQNAFADEGTHRLLMKARYLCGNKSGALSTYERLERALREELGAEPHRLTRELAERIRRNQEVSDVGDI